MTVFPGRAGRRRFAAALAALAHLCGCDDDPDCRSPERWQVAAGVFDHRDGSPRAGVPLLLVDVEANRPLAGPLPTGADGLALFAAAPPGRYAVIAFPGVDLGLWLWPGSFPLPPEPGASAPPWAEAVHAVRILTFDRPPGDGLPRISGLVIEAQTERPLAHAFVHLAGSIDAYLGAVSPQEAVTDDEGRFTVQEIPFAPDPFTGEIRQVVPLVIQREGYLPRTWRSAPLLAGSDLDIAGVRIALAPLDGAPAGVVAGRVVFLGEPVAGVPVGLSFVGEAAPPPVDGAKGAAAGAGAGATAAGEKARLGLPGAVARTDGEGRFRFDGVPAGWWLVHPAFDDDDGFLVVGTGGELSVLVTAGQRAEAGDLPVVRQMRALAPPPGAAIADTLPRLVWSGIAEADSYLVAIDGEAVAWTAEPAWQIPVERALAPGVHTWGAEAYTPGRIPAGLTDYRPHRIRLLVEPAK